MGDFWGLRGRPRVSHGRPRVSHGCPWGSQLSSDAGEALVFHRKASFTCMRTHFRSRGSARMSQGRPWRWPGSVQKIPGDAQGTPSAPKIKFTEIGLKRQGPKSDEKQTRGVENQGFRVSLSPRPVRPPAPFSTYFCPHVVLQNGAHFASHLLKHHKYCAICKLLKYMPLLIVHILGYFPGTFSTYFGPFWTSIW